MNASNLHKPTDLKLEYKNEKLSLSKRINYCENCISSATEEWVKKEYRQVIEGCQSRINEIETILNNWN